MEELLELSEHALALAQILSSSLVFCEDSRAVGRLLQVRAPRPAVGTCLALECS
jgi:hypothetical protein